MTKNPPDEAADARSAPSPLDDLESPTDAWLELLRRAERPRQGGRIGNYEILAELGRGGQGLVLRARDPATDRVIALKRLAAGAFSSAAARRRFEREIEVVTSLSHPGIVSVFGVEEIDGVPLLSMEWVDGQALNDWAAGQPGDRRGLPSRLELFLQVCAAVQYAHGRGVIHRDLKPSNILVDGSGRCRLLDFGLARRFPLEEEVTRTVGFVGTPAYAAPEFFREGNAPVDVRSDVYSLGVVLFECLTGQRPFRAQGLRELIQEIVEHEPARPSSLAPGLDRELDAVVLKACAKDPELRYPTVHALQEDLRRYLDGRSVQAVPPSTTYLVRKWVLRNRMAFGLSLALCLALVAGAFLGFWQAAVIAAERDKAEDALAQAQDQAQRAIAVQQFHLEALRSTIDPALGNPTRKVDDVLSYTATHVRERLGQYPDLAAGTLAQVAQHYFVSGDTRRADAVAREGLELLHGLPTPKPLTQSILTNIRGRLALFDGRLEEGLALLEEGARLYEDVPNKDPNEHATILFQLGAAQLDHGDLAAAERNLGAALEAARGSPLHLTGASTVMVSLLLRTRRPEEAERLARETFELTAHETPSNSMPVALACASLAEVLANTERLSEAVAHQERAIAIDRKLLVPSEQSFLYELARLGRYRYRAGQHEASLKTFEEVERLAQLPNDAATGAGGLALAYLALGEVDQALPCARRFLGGASSIPAASTDFIDMLFASFHVLIAADQLEEGEGLFPRWAEMARAAARAGAMPEEQLLEQAFDDVRAIGFEGEFDALFTELLDLAKDKLTPEEWAAYAALRKP